jgi:hypothetical protein
VSLFDAGAGAGQPWEIRALLATHGTQTHLGAIVVAILHRRSVNGRWIGHAGVVTHEGVVVAALMEGDDVVSDCSMVAASTEELRSELNGLADYIDATDAEREAMFLKLRQWITKDFRADRNALDRINPTLV